MSATLNVITPLIPTGASLDEALAFYTVAMGFRCSWRTDTMAGIDRDGISFHLVQNSERAWADNASFSIGVSDLDALYEEYRGLPADVGLLEMKAWDRREFHMIVASGVCFQFYEAAPQSPVNTSISQESA